MKIALYRGLAVTVAIGVLLVQPDGAQSADGNSFIVCNKTATTVSVSIGYKDAHLGWTSEGWWTAPPGECTKNLFRGGNKVFYYYAHNADRVIWSGEKSTDGSSFCTSPKAYSDRWDSHRVADKSYDCEQAGLNKRKFRRVLVDGAKAVNLRSGETAPPVTDAPAAPPAAVKSPAGPPGPPSSACQRYPNLC
jgi:uncharacterized membrane protein